MHFMILNFLLLFITSLFIHCILQKYLYYEINLVGCFLQKHQKLLIQSQINFYLKT